MSESASRLVWLGPSEADDGVTSERVGSKAAGLWRIGKLGLPTPPAFVLPTSLCAAVDADPGAAAKMIAAELRAGVQRLEAATGKRLGDSRSPLLVSVRSGAAASMPGMLATVLNVGLGPSAVRGLIRQTGDPRFAWDSYRRFIESYAITVGGAAAEGFARAAAEMVRAEMAADEADLDGEAMERLALQFAELASRHGSKPLPDDPMDQLTEAAFAVFRSWRSPKAREYRRLNGLEHLSGTAVTVQAMVFGNTGPGSGSGVAFSRDPATGDNRLYLDFLFDAQGEDLVSGRRTPVDADALAARLPGVFDELAQGAEALERACQDVQDIEFTVERGRLFFLQTRDAKRTPRAALRTAVDFVREGLIEPDEALRRLKPVDLAQVASTHFAESADVVAHGIGASSGVVTGRAAFDTTSAKRLKEDGEPVVLVRREPATEDIEGFAAADGILTSLGGRTAHAAVVARQMAKVCVVGCGDLQIDATAGRATLAGRSLERGDWISLDGGAGEVSLGRRVVVAEQPLDELAEVESWRARRSTKAQAVVC